MHLRFGQIAVIFCSLLNGQTAAVTNGNIVIIDVNGAKHQITDEGKDSEPSLSPDGKHIVFIRALREAPGIGVPTVVDSELWIAASSVPTTPKRAYRGPLMLPDGRFSNAFYAPKFSPSGAFVYFLADYSATSGALCRLELTSGKAQFISPAMEYDVLRTGKYRGFLIANIRSLGPPDDDGIRYPIYPYYLLTPSGKQYRRAAGPEANLSDVVKAYSH